MLSKARRGCLHNTIDLQFLQNDRNTIPQSLRDLPPLHKGAFLYLSCVGCPLYIRRPSPTKSLPGVRGGGLCIAKLGGVVYIIPSTYNSCKTTEIQSPSRSATCPLCTRGPFYTRPVWDAPLSLCWGPLNFGCNQ